MSGCEVDFSYESDDADPVSMYVEKIVPAKKDHVCTECGAPIPKGTRHMVKSYKFEGVFHTDRVCDPCREIAGEFEYRLIGGELWASFRGQWEDGQRLQACLNRLESASAKAHMHAQWTRWHERHVQRQREYAARARARRAGGGAQP